MKMNKEQFLKTEFGGELESTTINDLVAVITYYGLSGTEQK